MKPNIGIATFLGIQIVRNHILRNLDARNNVNSPIPNAIVVLESFTFEPSVWDFLALALFLALLFFEVFEVDETWMLVMHSSFGTSSLTEGRPRVNVMRQPLTPRAVAGSLWKKTITWGAIGKPNHNTKIDV